MRRDGAGDFEVYGSDDLSHEEVYGQDERDAREHEGMGRGRRVSSGSGSQRVGRAKR